MSEFLLSVDNLKKDYTAGGHLLHILKDINIRVKKGERILISGVSGSGKTTLLNIIGILDAPTSGTLSINGRSYHNLSEYQKTSLRRKEIGFVFQDNQVLPEFTVLENVCLPGYINNKKPSDVEKEAKELLLAVGLEKRLNYYPEKLSGGEKQRVAIARALINQPSLVLADEPTGSLDVETKLEVQKIFKDVSEKIGAVLIVVSHDTSFTGICPRHFKLEHGELILISPFRMRISECGMGN